jgi:hypothetical protein
MAAEPLVRVHTLMDAGYYVNDSICEIDGQVARQLVHESVVEIVDPGTAVDLKVGGWVPFFFEPV